MLSTPQQSLQSLIEAVQLQTEVEDQESGSYERLMVTEDEESRTKAQEVDNEANQKWTVVYQTIAKTMLKYLDESEALKVSTKELQKHVLSPCEPDANIVRIRGMREVKKARSCSRFSADKDQTRSLSPVSKRKDKDWWSIDLEGESEAGGRMSSVRDRRRIRGSQKEDGPLVSSDKNYKRRK